MKYLLYALVVFVIAFSVTTAVGASTLPGNQHVSTRPARIYQIPVPPHR